MIGDLYLKRGAIMTLHISPAWAWTGLTGLASPLVWLGIVFLILSFITWLYVLKHLALSAAFPGSQVVQIMVPLGSWLLLGAWISLLRWRGILPVILPSNGDKSVAGLGLRTVWPQFVPGGARHPEAGEARRRTHLLNADFTFGGSVIHHPA